MFNTMWLKIEYASEDLDNYVLNSSCISVKLVDNTIAPIDESDRSVRMSPIFPLVPGSAVKAFENGELYFFEFECPFRVLGKIIQLGSPELKKHVFFSCGICSVIVFASTPKIVSDLAALLKIDSPRASEIWELQNGKIVKATVAPSEPHQTKLKKLRKYNVLPPDIRTILDEFAIGIRIIANKTGNHEIYNYTICQFLIVEVNKFINELIYLHKLTGKIPSAYWANDPELLKDPMERQSLIHQIVDRLIQINSSISYVSTQMYSGSVPILERRSLIRRNSLLGVGAAIAALNRIVDYVEAAFGHVNFSEIIRTELPKFPALSGMEDPTHPDKSNWFRSNIDNYECAAPLTPQAKKLAYFSSRYGFRESEYAITAALNALSNGLTLEWSMMTITHELLHSHVRMIIASLFFEKDGTGNENYRNFYEKFRKKQLTGVEPDEYLRIDSIRELIFIYTLRTPITGSLTVTKKFDSKLGILVPETYGEFYRVFKLEQRNINEILVHVLDLHYFYLGRVYKYIPLIWCSWSSVPNVKADIRQYILRSLLAIASKANQNEKLRWKYAVDEFRAILAANQELVTRFPLLQQVEAILADDDFLGDYYFNAFMNGLILVDVAMQLFFSHKVAAKLCDDTNVIIRPDDASPEVGFSYAIEPGFVDVSVDSPIPFLFDRMLRVLDGRLLKSDQEQNTIISLLAMNSR